MADSDLQQELARVLEAPAVGPGDLTIWGGKFDDSQLGSFLAAWGLPRHDMPWCLWEHVSRLTLEKETLPAELELLERGRVFGGQGDLALRRDGRQFQWSFVGAAGISQPPGCDVVPYWAPGRPPLRAYQERALLWGERRGGERYYDDRVARAQLLYPLGEGCRRVLLHYLVYMNGGRIEFVRLQRLEGVA